MIGAGLFGCTIAAQLKSKHEVHLFEQKDSILRGASFANQYRLHRGYHYPRSSGTMIACRTAAAKFAKRFPGAIMPNGGKHVYAIARGGSRTDPGAYLTALEAAGLTYEILPYGAVLDQDSVELAIEAVEDWVDISALRGALWRDLRGVKLHLGTCWGYETRDEFDRIVIATYANTETAVHLLGGKPLAFQYEVVEKPILEMPDGWARLGVVVMDGPFCSVDPFGSTDYHVMGHVERAIIHRSVGHEPEIPEAWRTLVNSGVIRTRDLPMGVVSRAGSMVVDGARWLPGLMDAKHIGSMFTVRAVLPHVNDTDERPTIVDEVDEQVIRVFSGKLAGCIQAAEEVEAIVDGLVFHGQAR